MKRIVIAPHIDDDVLGCGGIIDKDTLVIYCGVDDYHVVSREERLKEADSVKEYLGNDYKLYHGHKVNNYKSVDLIDEFSKTINNHKPEEIYIPYPSYNQDHRAVYEAIMISLRPHDINFFVKKVLVYEQPHVFLWNDTYKDNFKPNYFVPIDIDRKIKAYELMKSQVRDFRSSEDIRALSQLRGTQSGCDYAESFQIIRWVD
tara:strand:- start:18 stop:626 length:609 start_codon:yes stop_codon:yes gene_type:complete